MASRQDRESRSAGHPATSTAATCSSPRKQHCQQPPTHPFPQPLGPAQKLATQRESITALLCCLLHQAQQRGAHEHGRWLAAAQDLEQFSRQQSCTAGSQPPISTALLCFHGLFWCLGQRLHFLCSWSRDDSLCQNTRADITFSPREPGAPTGAASSSASCCCVCNAASNED